MVCSTDRSKAVVPVLVFLFVALWFILRGDLFYVLPCVILFLCFSVLLALRLPRLVKRELILVFFVCFVCSICACLVLSVSSSSWCLGRAAVYDCDTHWTFLLPFSSYVAFVLAFSVLHLSFYASGRLCVVAVAFPGYFDFDFILLEVKVSKYLG